MTGGGATEDSEEERSSFLGCTVGLIGEVGSVSSRNEGVMMREGSSLGGRPRRLLMRRSNLAWTGEPFARRGSSSLSPSPPSPACFLSSLLWVAPSSFPLPTSSSEEEEEMDEGDLGREALGWYAWPWTSHS